MSLVNLSALLDGEPPKCTSVYFWGLPEAVNSGSWGEEAPKEESAIYSQCPEGTRGVSLPVWAFLLSLPLLSASPSLPSLSPASWLLKEAVLLPLTLPPWLSSPTVEPAAPVTLWHQEPNQFVFLCVDCSACCYSEDWHTPASRFTTLTSVTLFFSSSAWLVKVFSLMLPFNVKFYFFLLCRS